MGNKKRWVKSNSVPLNSNKKLQARNRLIGRWNKPKCDSSPSTMRLGGDQLLLQESASQPLPVGNVITCLTNNDSLEAGCSTSSLGLGLDESSIADNSSDVQDEGLELGLDLGLGLQCSSSPDMAIGLATPTVNLGQHDTSELNDSLTDLPEKKSQRIETIYASLPLPASIAGPITAQPDSVPNYIFTDSVMLNNLVSSVCCTYCKQATLLVEISHSSGFSNNMVLRCSSCGETNGSSYTSQRVPTEQVGSSRPAFDINRRVTQSFIQMGKGYSAIEQFCSVMNMTPMCSASFQSHAKELHQFSSAHVDSFLEYARAEVRKAYLDIDPLLPRDQRILAIGVSYDGSWHKRGFTSLYGIGCVVDLLTGYVIDYYVMSKYCQSCEIAKKDLGAKSPEFAAWQENHEGCQQNYNGSSPAMEVHAADILWKRSEQYGFRYTTLLSDGDSKTFNHLVKEEVYGPDIVLEKEECVNHVSKRLGTALRNLVTECRAKGVTLGGASYGSLKQTTIKKLTKYYQSAIRNNLHDVQDMKKAVFATLHHNSSTDVKPQHQNCPTGITSWCFFNRAQANNNIPGTHKDNLGTPLSTAVLIKALPIYQRLASESLLGRCLLGRTSNANESLHSTIWNKCPKERFVSKYRIDEAASAAIVSFNNGFEQNITHFMTSAGLSLGDITVRLAKRIDLRRISKSKMRASLKFQRLRRAKRMSQLKVEEEKTHKEGKTYGAGDF